MATTTRDQHLFGCVAVFLKTGEAVFGIRLKSVDIKLLDKLRQGIGVMCRQLRRCLVIAVPCVAVVILLSLLQAPHTNNYYGDVSLIPHQKYFIPSRTEQIFLEHQFLLTSDVCSSSGGPFLIVMVMSIFNMTSQREAIRDTWGSVARVGQWPGVKGHFDVKLVFLFGEEEESRNDQLQREADARGDIVQASFRESYDNLTLKVLMGYRWVEKNCPQTKYVMKVDEDVVVNIPYFISKLKSTDLSRHILGPLSFSEFVIRDGKYRASKSAYYPDIYPPHVKGNMYVMAKPVAMRLLHTAPFLSYLRIEDAFITGVLAKVHGIRHIDITEAIYDRHVPASYCDFISKIKVMSQKYTPAMMRALWTKVKENSQCSLFNIIMSYFTH